MTRPMKLSATLVLAFAVHASGQEPRVAPPRFPGLQTVTSPEVSPDGQVTFRLRAPNAREVLVRGITPEPIAKRKNEEGVWSVTTEAPSR
jgi:hypothetical protein